MVHSARKVILVLLLLLWAGALLVGNSPAPGKSDHPDRIAWADGSVLNSLLKTLNLDYAWPTFGGNDVKGLIFRGGATMIAVFALVAWGLSLRRRPARGRDVGDDAGGANGRVGRSPGVSFAERDELLRAADAEPPADAGAVGHAIPWRHPTPSAWVLIALAGYFAWTGLAAFWSHAPRESVVWVARAGFLAALATAVGLSLNRTLTRVAAGGWVALASVCCVLELWYRHERGPWRPLQLFMGDSKELAGVLLPALVIALGGVVRRIDRLILPRCEDDRSARTAAGLALLLALGGLMGGTVRLCSTGAMLATAIALPVGLGVFAALLVDGKKRWAMLAAGAAVSVGLLLAIGDGRTRVTPSPATDGRLTARHYQPDEPLVESAQWEMAARLFAARAVVGHGGEGFRLLADGVAAERAESDPRWADRPVADAGSLWLEQLTDFGAVGIALLAVVAALLWSALTRAAVACRRGEHRWLLAGLAGGLAAMGVQEFFASSMAQWVFPAVAAGWAGLVVAAVRWSGREERGRGDDEYRWGFYHGGLSFLAGALMVLVAVGTIVAQDWRAARNYYRATVDDPTEISALAGELQELAPRPSPTSQQDDRADLREQAEPLARRFQDAIVRRQERAAMAARWTMSTPLRLAALRLQAAAIVDPVSWSIERAARQQWAIRLNGGRAGAVDVHTSGLWVDEIEKARVLHATIRRVHPQAPDDAAVAMARLRLMAFQGRALTGWHAQVIASEMRESLKSAAALLDEHLADRPNDLEGVLMRCAIGDPMELAVKYLGDVGQVFDATRFVRYAGVAIPTPQRLVLLADGIRDAGLEWTRLSDAGRSQGRSAGSLPALMMPAQFYDALARLEHEMSSQDWRQVADRAIQAEARLAAGSADLLVEDPQARRAPQMFRLLAERALLAHLVLGRQGLVGLPGQTDYLAEARGWLARAVAMYDRDGRRFALQRVILHLELAQLAWQQAGGPADEAMGHLRGALEALDEVDRSHRPGAERAAAVLATFLLAEQGRDDAAMGWYERSGYRQAGSLARFHDFLARNWRAWLAAPPPSPTTQPESPTTQPEPLWPEHRYPADSLIMRF
ncbi:MAG: hypothetical protein BIFFINMI_01283 [Phycisphaerae bacterium]|nr:hypothetical protein [Phycisphaerae bacterium]